MPTQIKYYLFLHYQTHNSNQLSNIKQNQHQQSNNYLFFYHQQSNFISRFQHHHQTFSSIYFAFSINYLIYFKYLFILSIKSLIIISKLNNSFIKSPDQKHNHQKYYINYFRRLHYLFIIFRLFISSI